MPDHFYKPGFSKIAFASAVLLLIAFASSDKIAGQTLAVIDPAGSEQSRVVSEELARAAGERIKVLDTGLSAAAFRSFTLENPFNLDTSVAKDIGSAIGCTHFVIVRTAVTSRSASGRELYYEAHAAYYLVSARTGRLSHWEIATFEKDSAAEAISALLASVPATADALAAKATSPESEPPAIPSGIDAAPERTETSSPPMPYRRISPVYTKLADLHGIAATVDIEVAIGADGAVIGTEILRWAGYGLDESVESAVRTMQWRPGERNGRILPMRVLLRYNFRDIDDVD